VSQASFDLVCDRLSSAVDKGQFERLRWERNEGPMLARLVSLAHAALEQRSEFELAEEGSSSALKRFVLKVHSNRVVAISIWLGEGLVHIRAEEIERSRYRLIAGNPLSADFKVIDEQWMADALRELFSRVES
jgi:hypothetical protein